MTLTAQYSGKFHIQPMGRVGQPRRGHCRARRYWIITEFDPKAQWLDETTADGVAYRIKRSYVPREEYGKFKTKRLTIAKLKELSDQAGLKMLGDADGYPWVEMELETCSSPV